MKVRRAVGNCALSLTVVFCASSMARGASDTLRLVALTGRPAPGTPDGVKFRALTTPTLNNGGQTAFSATLQLVNGVTTANDQGLWSEGSGALGLLAREGSPAHEPPSGAVFNSFLSPLLNNAGQGAFNGALRVGTGGVTSSNDAALWLQVSGVLQLFAREGDQAPGTPSGAVFSAFSDVLMNGSGVLAFNASLKVGTGGVTRENISGIWSGGLDSLRLVARQWNPAPGMPDGTVFSSISSSPVLNSTGNIAFSATLTGGGVTLNDDTSLWSESGGSLHLVAREGGKAPGAPYGATYINFTNGPVINNDGHIAFGAFLRAGSGGVDTTNDSGIWAESGGSLQLVIREGTHAPGTPDLANFASFGNIMLNNGDQLAFFASLRQGSGDVTSSNDTGLWSYDGNSVQLVAREGSHAPGTPEGVKFGAFNSPIANSAGQVAFMATLLTGSGGVTTANNVGIWAEDVSGVLRLVVRTGDQLDVGLGELGTVSSLGFYSGTAKEDGRRSGFNDLGQIAFRASFTNDTSAVFISNLATVPEPATLWLCILALASAVRRQNLRPVIN